MHYTHDCPRCCGGLVKALGYIVPARVRAFPSATCGHCQYPCSSTIGCLLLRPDTSSTLVGACVCVILPSKKKKNSPSPHTHNPISPSPPTHIFTHNLQPHLPTSSSLIPNNIFDKCKRNDPFNYQRLLKSFTLFFILQLNNKNN